MRKIQNFLNCTMILCIAGCMVLSLGLVQPRTVQGEEQLRTTQAVVKEAVFPITKGTDDIEYQKPEVIMDSSDLEISGYDKDAETKSQTTYLRFENIQLPQGRKLVGAYLEFTGDEASIRPATMFVRMEKTRNAPEFTTDRVELINRKYTMANVAFQTLGVVKDGKYRTPNLISLFQEVDSNMMTNLSSASKFTFKISGIRDGEATMMAYEMGNATAPRLILQYETQEQESVYQIQSPTDDAEEQGTAKTVRVDTPLDLGGYTTSVTPENENRIGVRFPNVDLPENAKITDAHLEFTSAAPLGSARSTMTFRTETADAQPYKTVAKDISNRKYTAGQVSFKTPVLTAGKVLSSPNLQPIIDEARVMGWKSGMALGFTITGTQAIGTFFEGGTAQAPKLVIQYTIAGDSQIGNIITDPSQMNNIYINEVAAEGTSSEANDWIELYNANEHPVYINGGIYLQAGTTNPKSFEIKQLYIPPKSYRILIADEKTDKDPYHVNFKLSGKGNTLQLVTADGRTIDQFTYGGNSVYNDTYGRLPDNIGTIIQFVRGGTYGSTNVKGLRKISVTPSVERGVYEKGFNLQLTAPKGATIRYTTDGTFPTKEHGTIYRGPITVNQSMTINTIAYSRISSSNIEAFTYVLLDNYKNEHAYNQDAAEPQRWIYKDTITPEIYSEGLKAFPIISVTSNTKDELTPKADYVQSTFEYLSNHVDGKQNIFQNAGAKKTGQASVTQFNSGMALKFTKSYNTKTLEANIFPTASNDGYKNVSKFKKLELKEGQDGPQDDDYFLGYNRYSEQMVQQLQLEMNKFSISTKYVHYFYNGQYRGVKTLREDFSSSTFAEYFGGDEEDYTEVNFQDNNYNTGLVEDGNPAVYEKIKQAVAAKDYQTFKNYVDVDDFIKMQILFMFIDTENEVFAIVHEDPLASGKKMKFNIHDTDGAFYNANKKGTDRMSFWGGGTYRSKWVSPNITSRKGPGGMFATFSGDSQTDLAAGNLEFKTQVKDRVLQYMGPSSGTLLGAPGAPLSHDNVLRLLDVNQEALDKPYALDAAFMGENNTIYSMWKKEQTDIETQLTDRVQFSLTMWKKYGMAHTLEAASGTEDAAGVVLAHPATEGDLYYTLDGTDPMGADGVVSPAAQKYTGALTNVPAGTKITTRAFMPNNWGPLSVYTKK